MADGAEFLNSNSTHATSLDGPSPDALACPPEDGLVRDLGQVAAGNLAAASASATVAAKGAEALVASAMAFTRETLQDHHAIATALMSVQTLHEAMELQAAFTSRFRSAYLAQLNAVTNILTETAQDAAKPLSARASGLAGAIKVAMTPISSRRL